MIRLRDLITETTHAEVYDYLRQHIDRIAAEHAETPARKLGAGYWGEAWLMQSGRVLKFTADPSEAALAARTSRRPASPHLIGVYSVRPITGIPLKDPNTLYDDPAEWQSGRYGARGYYVIHQDGITPLSEYGVTLEFAYNSLYTAIFNGGWTTERLLQRIDRMNYSNRDAELLQRIVSQADSIRRDMRRFGVNFHEAHSGNVGFNASGNFVIYDMQAMQGAPGVKPSNLGKPIDMQQIAPVYTTDGIDTPGDPDM